MHKSKSTAIGCEGRRQGEIGPELIIYQGALDFHHSTIFEDRAIIIEIGFVTTFM